jgi:amino acid transporter
MSCRPAVVISYSVAALAAIISALSYTEFVVDLPTAGGAYNYISLVFGELTAWCAVLSAPGHAWRDALDLAGGTGT